MAHPQYLKSMVHEELSKVNRDFGNERAELPRGCKTKKMSNLPVLSSNLTNMHSTCILRYQLGLGRKN